MSYLLTKLEFSQARGKGNYYLIYCYFPRKFHLTPTYDYSIDQVVTSFVDSGYTRASLGEVPCCSQFFILNGTV